LTQAQFQELVRILQITRPVPFIVGQGRRPRVATSHASLGRAFGISRQRVTQIAKAVRSGQAHPEHSYGTRAMRLGQPKSNGRGGYLTSYERGISLPSPQPGMQPIVRPQPGAGMLGVLEAVSEGRLRLF
jgi:hypothetical protein